MGLDQWLHLRVRVDEVLTNSNKLEVKTDTKQFEIPISEIKGIDLRAMYWRKNYAINQYFLDKAGNPEDDNCIYLYIDRRDIIELRDHILEIIRAKTKEESLELAKKYLPARDLEEFFDFYLNSFKETVGFLDDAISKPYFEFIEFYYYIWY